MILTAILNAISQNAQSRLEEERKIMERQRAHFEEIGHTGEELDRLMQPLHSFHNQVKEEVERTRE